MFNVPPPPPPALVRTVQSAEPPEFSPLTNPEPVRSAIHQLWRHGTPEERQQILDHYIRDEGWLTRVERLSFEAQAANLPPHERELVERFMRMPAERWLLGKNILEMDHANAPNIRVTAEDDLNDHSPHVGLIRLTNQKTGESARISVLFYGTDQMQNQDTFATVVRVLEQSAKVIPQFYADHIAADRARRENALNNIQLKPGESYESLRERIENGGMLLIRFDPEYIPSSHTHENSIATHNATTPGNLVSSWLINSNHTLLAGTRYKTAGIDGRLQNISVTKEELILHEILHLNNITNIEKILSSLNIDNKSTRNIINEKYISIGSLSLLKNFSSAALEQKNNVEAHQILGKMGFYTLTRLSYNKGEIVNELGFLIQRKAKIQNFQDREAQQAAAEAAKITPDAAKELLIALVDYDRAYSETHARANAAHTPKDDQDAQEEFSAIADLYQESIKRAAGARELMVETANAADAPPEWRQVLEKIGGFYDTRTPALPQVEPPAKPQASKPQTFNFVVNQDVTQKAMDAFIAQQLLNNFGLSR
jgi:hypothetical protein